MVIRHLENVWNGFHIAIVNLRYAARPIKFQPIKKYFHIVFQLLVVRWVEILCQTKGGDGILRLISIFKFCYAGKPAGNLGGVDDVSIS